MEYELGWVIVLVYIYIPGDIYMGVSGIQVSTFNWVIKSQCHIERDSLRK